MRRFWKALGSTLSLPLFLCLLLFPAQVQQAAAQSLSYCLGALVPSLFPFLVLSGWLTRSRAGETLERLLSPVTRTLFRMPEVCGLAILLSFLGGYPAGAACAAHLLEEERIDRDTAGRMLLFCVGPGPAFVVSFVGGLLGSYFMGWLLLLCVTLSGLLLGVLTGLGKPLPPKAARRRERSKGGLIEAVRASSLSMLTMCGCILFFAGLCAPLRTLGKTPALLSFLLEVTGGVGDAVSEAAPAWVYAFGLGFGGLCVHLQLFSLFEDFPARKWSFFLFRFLHGGLSALLCRTALLLLPRETLPVWVQASQRIKPLSLDPAAGLSLLMMCGAFLLTVAREEKPCYTERG